MLPLLCFFTFNSVNFHLEEENELNKVDIGYKDGRPFAIELHKIPGKDLNGNHLYLTDQAQDAWLEMVSDAARDGIYLKANFAFRSKEQQKTIKKKKGKWAARPGFSDHQMGLSIDVAGTEGGRGKTSTYYWLKNNSYKYGFKHTVAQEPWHITFQENINNS